MRPLGPSEEPVQDHLALALKVRTLEDPDHLQELQEELLPYSPCYRFPFGGRPPAAPVFSELSSGLPLLIVSSGEPTLPRAGSRVLAGTDVLH